MKYPRPGEPIVPRLLRSVVAQRRSGIAVDADSEMVERLDLGRGAWERLPHDTCMRLGLLIVDRVQTRLGRLPRSLCDVELPDPAAALALPLERRTLNTLRRAATSSGFRGPWTVARYVAFPRFGGRALLDLLAAIEAHGEAQPAPVAPGVARSDDALNGMLVVLGRELPIGEGRANANLLREGLITQPLDLAGVLRVAAQQGRPAPLRVIDIAGSRVLVRLSDITLARDAYRLAARALKDRGAVTIASVTGQLRAAAHLRIGPTFVERLLQALAVFRWLERSDGWFWFVERPNPLLANLRKILSVARSVPLPQLSAALFRARAVGAPSEAIQRICAGIPGARVADGAVTIEPPLDRTAHLNPQECRIVDLFERAGGTLPLRQLRRQTRSINLHWTPVSRLLRSSPLFERAREDLFRLVGAP